MKLFATSGCLLLVLLLGVAQAQQLACDRGTRGGNADRQTVTFQCRGTIPRGNSATVTPDWRRFLTAATRFDSTRLTVNSPTPGETRVKVAGTFQGANGNNIKTCQTRRGLILAGGAPAITVGVGPAAAAATIMYDSDEHYKGDSEHYKGDSEHYKHSGEYKKHYDEDSDSYKPMPPAPFTGEVVIFSPIVIAPPAAPVAAPAPKSRKYGDDKYEEDKYEDEDKYEEEYYYNEEDASYYSAKFDDWEEAATEQDASLANFGNDQRQCTPRVRGAQASIASLAPQQNNRQPETPRALRLVVKCKSGPNGQNANQCVVQLQLVASFTGGFVPGVL